MKYRYSRWQLFAKKLNVPKDIQEKIYNRNLSLKDYINYDLIDKIPFFCLSSNARSLAYTLKEDGLKRLKTTYLDLNLVERYAEDINNLLFRYDIIPDNIIEIIHQIIIPQTSNDEKKDFLKTLLKNQFQMSDEEIERFNNNYGNTLIILLNNNKFLNDFDIRKFIKNIIEMHDDKDKIRDYFSQYTDEILANTHRKNGDYRDPIKLSNDEYKEIFKYSSLEAYLKKISEHCAGLLIEELSKLPDNYIFSIPIPFSVLDNYRVLDFIGIYGLKNIVDFDNECGHFFTKNNCEMLNLMYDMYLSYAGNEHDPKMKIYVGENFRDENGNYVDRPYNKDDFYEAMRRMIIYGPTDWNYADKAPDYRNMTGEFRVRNAELFISDEAPEELQKMFYTKSITPQLLLEHPEYIQFLKGKDLSFCLKNREIKVEGSNALYGYENIYKFIGSKTDFNGVMNFITEYSYVLDIVFDRRRSDYYQYETEFSINDDIDQMKNRINETFIKLFVEKGLPFPKVIPQSMKNSYPLYFLPDEAPQEIKEKFYKREFNILDFAANPELFNMFEKTNIACGFPPDMAWVIPLFEKSDSIKMANYNRMKVITTYSKIQDVELQKAFKEYVMEFGTNIDVEKIEYVSEVLSRLSLSNSSEMFTFRKELATQILKSNNPLESLSKIEEVFIRNNIPTVGKIYSCFEILHPDFQGFNFESSMVSPVLKKSSTMSKKVTVFSDLIKSSFGSNNRSVNAYLKNIEFGSRLYESIKSGQIQFDSLGEVEMRELTTFCSHLATLYNNTMKAKKNNETFKSTGYVLTDILELSKRLSPDGTLDYNLADRIIRMFCGFTGIDTLEQAKEYIERKVKTADSRNRNASSSDMVLEQGDFIKGIGGISYLRNILQNGSVSKEYLGSSAGSDATPLDTDVSMIMSSDGTISEKIGATAASRYGPIWLVLKNDDRFITTRTSSETLEAKRDLSKMEVFYTGVLGQGHYGIRTGFASSEINYIVMDNYDPRVGLEIAMNGFYIPVANKEGKIVFTPKDYDELRTKMSGLSYYGMPDYNLSKNLISEEILETKERLIQDIRRTNAYASEIKGYICDAVKSAGIMNVVDGFNSDLTQGIAEIYSTGSTSRNTNVPNDSDFDYLIKVDRTIYFNPSKLETFKSKMKTKLGFTDGFGGKICGKIKKDTDDELDVEISFCPRTDKVELSTDTSLSSKLDAIKNQYPDSYMDVLANIVYAKELFKSINAYKSLKSDTTQGGLGGIGIENWILQHGGSFYDAAKDFVDEAKKAGSFEEFKKVYQVFDFGDNHYSDKSGVYPHDNFVGDENKMGQDGYDRMLTALKEYLKSTELAQVDTETIKR